ncbi:MFS transporter [Brevibacillus daliensis]|uniref:MFS transporter n=1 Tax=Brevibacillus daliensis TaxID=2892995 RepID=UPI001E2CA572|nr:MFS transporter [Brevibacillus daliensis]
MQKKHLLLLFLISFLMMLGFGIIIPILPFFVTNLGATATELGILSASYNVMQLLFAPVWGRLSDKYGRKPFILLALAGFSITFILFGLSTTYTELLIYRVLGGITSAAGIPTLTAMIADLYPARERAKGMGVIGAGIGLSFVFGPAIGGILGEYSLSLPFLVSGTLALVTFLVAIFFLPESLPKENRILQLPNQHKNSSVGVIFGDLGLLYQVLFITSLAFAGMETVFALYIKDLYGLTAKDMGYMFLIMGIVSVALQGGFIGKLVKRFGESTLLATGILLYVAGFICVMLSSTFLQFALTLCLFGIGQGLMRTTNTAMISQRTNTGQGVTSGNMTSMDTLGRIAGPVVAGWLYGISFNLPFMFSGFLSLLLFGMYVIRARTLPEIVHDDKSHPEH